jgi:hypothetical protein
MGLGRPEPCHNGLAEIVKEIVKNDLLATRSNGPNKPSLLFSTTNKAKL